MESLKVIIKDFMKQIKYIFTHLEEYKVETFLTTVVIIMSSVVYYYFYIEPNKKFINDINDLIIKIEKIKKEEISSNNSNNDTQKSKDSNITFYGLLSKDKDIDFISDDEGKIKLKSKCTDFFNFLYKLEEYFEVYKLKITPNEIDKDNSICEIYIEVQNLDQNRRVEIDKSIKLFDSKIVELNKNYKITNVVRHSENIYSFKINHKSYKSNNLLKINDDSYKLINIKDNKIEFKKIGDNNHIYFINRKKEMGDK